jgi:hypothetical protein
MLFNFSQRHQTNLLEVRMNLLCFENKLKSYFHLDEGALTLSLRYFLAKMWFSNTSQSFNPSVLFSTFSKLFDFCYFFLFSFLFFLFLFLFLFLFHFHFHFLFLSHFAHLPSENHGFVIMNNKMLMNFFHVLSMVLRLRKLND